RMKQRAVIFGRVCPNAGPLPAAPCQPKNVQKWCVVPWPLCPRNYVCRPCFLNTKNCRTRKSAQFRGAPQKLSKRASIVRDSNCGQVLANYWKQSESNRFTTPG